MSKAKKRLISLMVAIATVLGLGLFTAGDALAYNQYRKPSSGSYNCGGIPVAWYMWQETINGKPAYKISQFYVGTSVTSPSTTQTHFQMTALVFRQQDATKSTGGEDVTLSYNSGAYDANTTDVTGWQPTPINIAFRITYYEAPFTYTQPCTFQAN